MLCKFGNTLVGVPKNFGDVDAILKESINPLNFTIISSRRFSRDSTFEIKQRI